MQDTEGTLPPPGRSLRFSHVRAGPARALQAVLHALRRGDGLVALSASVRSERQAILTQAERLAGRYLSRTIWINAREVGSGFTEHLERSGLTVQEDGRPAVLAPWHEARTLLIVDEAEMLDTKACRSLCALQDCRSGNPVQVILGGGVTLMPRLCRPEFADLWRLVGVAVTLEGGAPRFEGEVGALREEIERAEARLRAQRRILAIFASDADAAPGADVDC